MRCASYSPKRVEKGVEARFLNESNANYISPPLKPINSKFYLRSNTKRNLTVMLGMCNNEVKSRTGIRSEAVLVAFALVV